MKVTELAYGGADRARAAAKRSLRNTLLALIGVVALRRASRSNTAGLAALLGFVAWSIRAKTPVLHVKGGPKHDPLVGGARHIPALADCFLNFWMGVARSTGFKTCELTLPDGKRIVQIHDERDRKYMLRDNWTNFQKNTPTFGFDIIFEELLGRGIFATDGAEWTHARKAASHLFSATALREQMQRVFVEHGRSLAAVLRERAEEGGTFDLQNMLQCLTFDTMCEISFGVSPGALESARCGVKPPFLVAFDEAQRIMATRFRQPNLQWQLSRWFGHGEEGDLPAHTKVIREYVDAIVARRTAEIAQGSGGGGAEGGGHRQKRKDLLSLFIQHGRSSGDARLLDPENLRDHVLNFMIAGRDTTACATTNLFKLLASNPAAKACIREELRTAVAADGGGEPSLMALKHATYADACFNETVRMYPPVGGDARFAIAADVLPSGLHVSTGDQCVIPNYCIGRNPKYWGPDADAFRPERWFERKGVAKHRLAADAVVKGETGRISSSIVSEQYTLPAFWAGPRLCLGKDMARFESKVLAFLVLVEAGLDIEPQPHEEHFTNSPVMFYSGGMPAKASIQEGETLSQ